MILRSRTRQPDGEWTPWRDHSGRPTHARRTCAVCRERATHVEHAVEPTMTVLRTGAIQRGTTVRTLFYCDVHTGVR